ncbi:MAG: hypothetical protein E7162_00010 [Firmicutes bacterium]|nr:hypothetical protein [Bacillota bacterium]
MNYLSWGWFCPEEYFGANIYKFFNYFDDLLLIITCVSIFLYFLLKKYKDKKLVVRIFKSLLWSVGLYFIVIFGRVILNLVLDSGRDYGSGWTMGYSCMLKSTYSIIFFFQYIFFFVLTYINTRIWYGFFDKNKKYMKWINIGFIILMIVILIISFFTSGTLN